MVCETNAKYPSKLSYTDNLVFKFKYYMHFVRNQQNVKRTETDSVLANEQERETERERERNRERQTESGRDTQTHMKKYRQIEALITEKMVKPYMIFHFRF